ncbi:hypothetical protein [Abyssalbus ytuae]|uniref:YD repeat-containing protein n=1 Tax=Abyssalbus ytuae TaxID=2926907 RepID=A0A9E6ZT89_9FLAO|nr:hypothetical protein [Abyssalbus ytuae]UOB16276.1 hypothetical protein MQE35_11060 [Abyssalbus ytuae]
MKKLIRTTFFLLTLSLSSQDFPITFPEILPPSPEAALFRRYGEIPVDLSTGVPNIEIPIYTLKSNQLELPIKLSYHAAGIKVQDVASPSGLGWVLYPAGIVTKTILGKNDEYSDKIYYKSSAEITEAKNNTTVFCDLLDNTFQYADSHSDRYSYHLPNGKSGVFRYDFTNDNLIQAPYSPVKITTNSTKSNFEITSEDGIKYIFDYGISNGEEGTSYKLTKIISQNKKDSIRFIYNNDKKNMYNSTYFAQTYSWGDTFSYEESDPFTPNCNIINSGGNSPSLDNTFKIKADIEYLLDSIVSTNTIIKYDYEDDRTDKAKYRISKISIISKQNNILINEIVFNQSYFGTDEQNNLRLRLDSIEIKGNTSSSSPQLFSFDYESLALPPYSSLSHQNCHEDFWGFYNGKNSNFYVPYEYIDANVRPPDLTSHNRMPDHNYAKACMLKTIHYPTGGKTDFEFEPNFIDGTYYYPDNNGQWAWRGTAVGGFRIENIKSFSESGSMPLIKSYKYTGVNAVSRIDNESYMYDQEYVYVMKKSGCSLQEVTGFRTEVTSNSYLPLTVGGQSAIIYQTVEEYIGNETENIGKIIYTYKSPLNPYDIGTTQIDHPKFKDFFHLDRGFYIPQISSKSEFKLEEGTYVPVKRTYNTYTSFRANQFITGIKYFRERNYLNRTDNSAFLFCNLPSYIQSIFYSDMVVDESVNLLTKTSIYDYSGSGDIVKTIEYKYENLDHLQPTQIMSTNSKGKNRIIKNYYSTDITDLTSLGLNNLTSIELLAINKLSQDNRLIEIIQSETYQDENNNAIGDNNERIASQRKNFVINNGMVLPASIQTLKGVYNTSNTLQDRLLYDKFDEKGNIIEISKKDGSHMSYIWGYNGQYVVAKIENATYSEIENILGANFNLGSNGLSTSQFNALKSGLPNAMMTTYTYDPLIGVTSITDPKGFTTYYQYDDFNRLEFVKDQEDNIISKNEYHYKNQN